MASKRFWNSYIQVWTLKTQCTKVIPFSLQLRFSQLLFPEACDRCELHALILRNQESLRGNHVNNGSCLKVEVGRFNTGKPQGFTVKCGCNIFISLASSYLHTLHILLDEKKKKHNTKGALQILMTAQFSKQHYAAGTLYVSLTHSCSQESEDGK